MGTERDDGRILEEGERLTLYIPTFMPPRSILVPKEHLVLQMRGTHPQLLSECGADLKSWSPYRLLLNSLCYLEPLVTDLPALCSPTQSQALTVKLTNTALWS